MSVDKMSAAVSTHIVSRLKDVITKSGSDTLTERKLNNFQEYASREQIRSDTDTVGGRHESIMSRQAFGSLLEDMSKAITEKTLSDELTAAVNTASFEGFVSYISEIYYKDKEFLLTDNKRVKNGFVYSGPTRNTTKNVAVYAKAESPDESYRDVILLKNIPQGDLVTYYADYISSSVPGISAETKKQLKNSLQGGHLTGVFTARLIRAFGLRKDTGGRVGFQKEAITPLTDLEKQLSSIVELVTDADFLSSNIVLDVDLFTETDKRLYSNAAEIRLNTEVQFAKTNADAGRMLSAAGTNLTKLIASVKPTVSNSRQEAAAKKAFKNLLVSLKKVSIYVKDRAEQLKQLEKTNKLSPKLQKKLQQILANQQTIDTLLTTEGSPSIISHIGSIAASIIEGKKAAKSQSKSKTKATASIPGKTSTTKPKAVAPAKKTKIVLKQKPIKYAKVQEESLTSLQNLINSQLQDVVSANMGDGDSRNILNYRTGRLAASARVEYLSESRQGMITAFYSYMKNPYATFSEGGRQSSPRTRDPKLLIAKSIREIAAQKVANRLRAVVV